MAKIAKKHVVPPATAEEISRAVGVTQEDRAIVNKVLTDLGYIGKKPVKTSPPKSGKSSKSRES